VDYNGGHVLPFAIARSAWIAVRRHEEPVVRCRSMQAPEIVEAPVHHLERPVGWASYVTGVVWALAGTGVPVQGADVLVDSEVPQGSGLSSSAALECATALAFSDLAGVDVAQPAERRKLALAAQEAESAVAGAPVGIMDQTVSLLAQRDHALYLDTRTLEIEHLPLPLAELGWSVLAVDTGTSHAHSANAYGERRSECRRAADALGCSYLTDVPIGAIDAIDELDFGELPPPLRRRARHVVTEETRTREAAVALRARQLARLGPLMTASHRSMQHDFENSTPLVDEVVEAAVGAGAAGARMTGGGWGGTVIALVEQSCVTGVSAAMRNALARAGRPDAEVWDLHPRAGAARVA
jgi:galactokinase